jgi:hypothetical protein
MGLRTAAGSAFLLMAFWGLYAALGLALASTTVFNYMDVLFGTDVERVVYDLTALGSDHAYTTVHPLFVLFFNPIGFLLAAVLSSKITAAVAINSFFGGLCVAGAHAFFRNAGLKEFHAVAFSVALGLSSAHLFFGSVPETWTFTAFSLIVLFLLSVLRPGRLAWFVPAGVFSLGILPTNFFQGLIVYFSSLWRRSAFGVTLKKLAAFAASVLLAGAALSYLQRGLYPSSRLFFLPGSWRDSLTWYLWRLGEPAEVVIRALRLIGYYFLFNIFAPGLDVTTVTSGKALIPDIPHVSFDIGSGGVLFFACSAMWLALVVLALYAYVRWFRNRPPVLDGLVLCGIFNFVLFTYYGSGELFIYTPAWTFLVLAWLALSLRPMLSARRKIGRVVNALVVALPLLELVTNLLFFRKIIAVYKTGLLPLAW